MRYYLVDLENLPKSLNNLLANKETKKCNLVVFYSENQRRMVNNLKENLDHVFNKVDYLYISDSSHNALDFNLVCYVGKLIGTFKGKTLDLFILSADKGYHAIKDFIKHQSPKYKLQIKYMTGIQEKECHLNVTMSVLTLLVGAYPNHLKEKALSALCKRDVIEVIKNNSNKGKQELWQSLRTVYGEKEGSQLYNILKTTYLKDLCL